MNAVIRKSGVLVITVSHPSQTLQRGSEKKNQRGILKSQVHNKRRVGVNCQNRDSLKEDVRSCLARRVLISTRFPTCHVIFVFPFRNFCVLHCCAFRRVHFSASTWDPARCCVHVDLRTHAIHWKQESRHKLHFLSPLLPRRVEGNSSQDEKFTRERAS